jgi:hypothetical protein
MGMAGIECLPAIRWKLINIEKMTAKKHRQTLRQLKDFLKL